MDTHCLSCGAPFDPSHGRCDHCGIVNDTDLRRLPGGRVEPAPGPSERSCPRCNHPLLGLRVVLGEAIQLERCKKCLGILLGPGDLERLIEQAATAHIDPQRLDALAAESRQIWPIRYLPCPACREPMQRRSQGPSVVLDWCKNHGTWLDGGELGQLLQWVRAGGR